MRDVRPLFVENPTKGSRRLDVSFAVQLAHVFDVLAYAVSTHRQSVVPVFGGVRARRRDHDLGSQPLQLLRQGPYVDFRSGDRVGKEGIGNLKCLHRARRSVEYTPR